MARGKQPPNTQSYVSRISASVSYSPPSRFGDGVGLHKGDVLLTAPSSLQPYSKILPFHFGVVTVSRPRTSAQVPLTSGTAPRKRARISTLSPRVRSSLAAFGAKRWPGETDGGSVSSRRSSLFQRVSGGLQILRDSQQPAAEREDGGCLQHVNGVSRAPNYVLWEQQPRHQPGAHAGGTGSGTTTGLGDSVQRQDLRAASSAYRHYRLRGLVQQLAGPGGLHQVQAAPHAHRPLPGEHQPQRLAGVVFRRQLHFPLLPQEWLGLGRSRLHVGRLQQQPLR